LVLAPIAIAALYFGGFWFLLFLAGAAAIMAYEWCHASLEPRPGLLTLIMAISIIAALVCSATLPLLKLALILLAGAALMLLAALVTRRRKHLLAAFFGPLLIGIPVVSLMRLRDFPENG